MPFGQPRLRDPNQVSKWFKALYLTNQIALFYIIIFIMYLWELICEDEFISCDWLWGITAYWRGDGM